MDPGLRRDDVDRGATGCHNQAVIPLKSGTHASLRAFDVAEEHRKAKPSPLAFPEATLTRDYPRFVPRGIEIVEAGVGPDLRRDDVVFGATDCT